jgi:hypothetical protein
MPCGALTDHGLKPRQFQTLDLLEDRGPIGPRELGDILGIRHRVLVTLVRRRAAVSPPARGCGSRYRRFLPWEAVA